MTTEKAAAAVIVKLSKLGEEDEEEASSVLQECLGMEWSGWSSSL